MRYTPENVYQLEANEVFVYGSNQFARHGCGSAYAAQQNFGAIYGTCPIGLCGKSYGIITTSFNDIPISLSFIQKQIEILYEFALLRPDLTFLVTKIGTGIAGFSIDQIASVFETLRYRQPANIVLPKEFTI